MSSAFNFRVNEFKPTSATMRTAQVHTQQRQLRQAHANGNLRNADLNPKRKARAILRKPVNTTPVNPTKALLDTGINAWIASKVATMRGTAKQEKQREQNRIRNAQGSGESTLDFVSVARWGAQVLASPSTKARAPFVSPVKAGSKKTVQPSVTTRERASKMESKGRHGYLPSDTQKRGAPHSVPRLLK